MKPNPADVLADDPSGRRDPRLEGYTPWAIFGMTRRESPYQPHERGMVGPESVDLDGVVRAGALGVFADTALAHPVMRGRPSPTLGLVTSELSMSFPTSPPRLGEEVSLREDVVELNDIGGSIAGAILGEGGRVLAEAQFASRFVDRGRRYDPRPSPQMDPPGISLADLLGVPEAQAGTAALHGEVAAHLANPAGALHGGIAVTLLEYAASRAVPEDPFAWECESLRVNYLRPAPLGDGIVTSARPVHVGRTICVVDAEIMLPTGKPSNIARLSYRRRSR